MAANPNLPPALQSIINDVLSRANPAPTRPLFYKNPNLPLGSAPVVNSGPARPVGVYKNPGFGPSTVSVHVTPSTNLTALFNALPSNNNPKLTKLQTQDQRMQNLIMGLGETPSHHSPNMLHRIFDVLSRPLYAVVNPALQFEKAINNGDSFGQVLEHTAGGVVHGLSGTQKAMTGDLFQYKRDKEHASTRADDEYQQFLINQGVPDSGIARAQFAKANGYKLDIKGNFTSVPITSGEGGRGNLPEAIIGMLGDVVLDPLTYVGVGPVTSIAKDAAKLINSGKLLEDVTPAVKTLKAVGVIDKDVPDDVAANFFIRPQEGGPISVPSDINAEGVRNLKETIDRSWQPVYRHNIKLVQDEMAARGEPILKNSQLPPVVKVPDFSNPEAVGAGFKKFRQSVRNWELLAGRGHPIIYFNKIKSPDALRKALHKAAKDGDEARREALLRDPKTGKNLLSDSGDNIAEVWRRQFAAVNGGAKSVEEAIIRQAKRTADLTNPTGKLASQIRKAYIAHQANSVIHQVAAPLQTVQKMREFIGRDPSKLAKFVTVGSKNGPFDEHIGTLAHFIEKDKKDHIGHAYTEEMRQAAENHWWERQYVNAARNIERAADRTFATGVEHMGPREAEIAKGNFVNSEAKRLNEVYKGNPKARQLVQTALGFSKQQWDKTIELRKQLISDSEARIKGLPVGDAIKEARAAGEKFSELNPEDFAPKRIDSTEYDAARIVNEQRKLELGKTAADNADKMFQDVKASLEAAVNTAFAPEMVKQIALRVGVGKASVEIMRSPEFLTKYLHQFLESDNIVTQTLKSFQHAFVSTGNMAPEIASLKNSAAGRVHQMVRFTIERLDKEFTQQYKSAEISEGFANWLRGNPTNPEISAKFDEHFNELAKQLRDPDMRRVGFSLQKLNAYLPNGIKLDIPSKKVVDTYLGSQEATVALLKSAVRGRIETMTEKRDPLDWLFNLHLASDRTITRSKLVDEIINSWGVSIKDPHTGKTSQAVSDLIKQYKYTTLQKVAEKVKGPEGGIPKVLKNYVFEPSIAHDLYRTLEMLDNNNSIEDFSRLITKGLQPWKAAVTIFNIPSYQARNAFQNTYQHWLALREINSNTVSMVKSLNIARKTIRGAHVNPALKRTLSPFDRAIDNQAEDTSVLMFANQNARGRRFRDVTGNMISRDITNAAFLQQGLDNGFITNQFLNRGKLVGKISNAGVGKVTPHNINKIIVDTNQSLENYYRYGLFIDAIRNSSKNTFEEAARDAAHVVRKYMFDYNDLTPFEKRTMVNIIPFYKWTRKAIPLMAETMFARPGKILGPVLAQREASQALAGGAFDPNHPYEPTVDKVLPDWIADSLQFPFGKLGGNTVYGGLALPFNDVAGTVTSVDQLMGMVSPLIRVPAELKTGHQFYHNIPITNPLEYATLGQLPQTSKIKNLVASLGPGPGQAPSSTGDGILLNILKNLGITQTTVNTPNAQISQLTKQLQQHQIQHKALVNKLTGQG